MLLDLIDQIFLRRRAPPPPSTSTTNTAAPDIPVAAVMAESKGAPETCPVDHKSREAWLAHAQAQSQAQAQAAPATPALPPAHPPVTVAGQEVCPVDHTSREVWLQQARSAAASSPSPPQPSTISSAATSSSSSSWSASLWSWVPFSQPTGGATASRGGSSPSPSGGSVLPTDREVSSIPRTATPGDAACPPNQEQETGADSASGNWIYPSQKMFFEAMKRKGHDPQSADMRTVVPIHNAVNERAWAEIKQWEEPYIKGSTCEGPRLHSFSGLSTKLTPKARFNTLLGYQAPFDRHDWVVDRCGKEIEYVIDFYAGRPNAAAGGQLSFYLDVRPKLNTWEGVKMRAMKGLGLV